jgi:diacylglycerol kinase family enzyme
MRTTDGQLHGDALASPPRATNPPRHPVLFVNPKSGGGKASKARLADKARERGIDVVEIGPARSLATSLDQALAADADVLGAAGGDGSLAAVAAAACTHQLPFVCVPAGTRNHLARDLGLNPHDPAGALDAFSDGVEIRIDMAEVNGRPFLNCVSLGVYGEAVRQSAYRDSKLRTLLETARAVRGPSRRLSALTLVDDLGTEHSHPAVVLISNNPYAMPRPTVRGARPALDGGRLGIIVIDAPTEGAHPSGRAWSASSLEIRASTTVHAGVDGEAVERAPPLIFAIRPAALRVRIPRSASARRPPRSPAPARRR